MLNFILSVLFIQKILAKKNDDLQRYHDEISNECRYKIVT